MTPFRATVLQSYPIKKEFKKYEPNEKEVIELDSSDSGLCPEENFLKTNESTCFVRCDEFL